MVSETETERERGDSGREKQGKRETEIGAKTQRNRKRWEETDRWRE